MRVGLAIDTHSSPPVGDNLDGGGVDVLVGLDEVGSENGPEELGWSDRVLFCRDVCGLLHSISSDHDAIIRFRIAVMVRYGLNMLCPRLAHDVSMSP